MTTNGHTFPRRFAAETMGQTLSCISISVI
jgi:hypothetical protein